MRIPHDFTMGVATAAYQIEGTNFGGCGVNHWDSFAKSGGTINGENGAIACDHFHHWQTDLDLIKTAGFDSYRFSFSWPRLFPDEAKNPKGFDFYDRLIDGMLERGLSPSATLYHWDLPERFAQNGGWENRDTADHFGDFAQSVGAAFGDRLDHVATINEPWCVAWLSHFLGHHAPGKTELKSGALAMHNILAAHAVGMSALRTQNVQNLGIVLNMEYAQPASDDVADFRAAQIYDGLYNRWFISAICKGEYPADILQYLEPHMPKNWQDDMAQISQKVDWLGLNYYTRAIIKDDQSGIFPFGETVRGPLDKTSMDWEIYPAGLNYFLQRIHDDYAPNLPLYVTENGMAWHDQTIAGKVSDQQRISYFESHIAAALKARQNGVALQGYYAWSLLDNFEWAFGYSERFGLVHVDFETQKRTPKDSWYWFQNLLSQRGTITKTA
ncbi:beta-glucosidase [Amylibacter ulvae]|uniref:Beta-glucosidase n=1 Tax=Paramylibacter ulvae TaxID=1651968 RepID=A0ABQ3D5Z5_9RHOB|nr:GH1 family beta-glucosidase [Amylibacter ulvae]GHA57306.1 beta-glucosidase [Amylibacter ulvae]